MTIVAVEDTRNTEWKSNNVGSKLLQKMGWKGEGHGIGKRQNGTSVALRAMKRQEGLGLGAALQTEGGSSDRSNHFANVLANLQAQHSGVGDGSDDDDKKKKKKSKSKSKSKSKKSKGSALHLPQNKVTAGHASKMRAAKFGAKSAEDMACIFGNKDFTPIATHTRSHDADLEPISAHTRSHDHDNDKKDDKTKKKRTMNEETEAERKERKRRRKEEKKNKKKKSKSSWRLFLFFGDDKSCT